MIIKDVFLNKGWIFLVSDERADFTKSIILLVISAFLSFLGVLGLTLGGGLSSADYVQRYILYFIFGISGVIFMLAVTGYFALTGKKRWFHVLLHDPEDSLLKGLRVVESPWLLTLLSFLVFVPLFWISANKNVFFASIPQQVTKLAGLFGASVLPGFNENILWLVPIGLASAFAWQFRKSPLTRGLLELLFIPLILGLLWSGFHNIVYGSDELALISTFIFGFVGILFTFLSHSIIPWTIIHILNNFFLSARENGLLASDLFIIEIIFFYIVILGLFIYSLRHAKRTKV